jgi:hypothetical protein
VGIVQRPNNEAKAGQMLLHFLRDKLDVQRMYDKLIKFYKIIHNIQVIWRAVCKTNTTRKQELVAAF